jgi:hypothetical protein
MRVAGTKLTAETPRDSEIPSGRFRLGRILATVVLLMTARLAIGQSAPSLTIGENAHLNAGATVSLGYAGDYGDAIQSSHGLNWGMNGAASGYYYNPNFLSFSVEPYYNQSRNDSDNQSLTGASGVTGNMNLFTGSNFPGSVNYHYSHNSTGTFGLAGLPNFTTVGDGQGFGVNWSALLPGLPTLSVGYSQGEGKSNIYGTSEQADSSTKLFNLRSGYRLAGFSLSAYYNHQDLNSNSPEFLTSEPQMATQESSGQSEGVGATHGLPLHGTFYADFNRSTASDNFSEGPAMGTNSSNYTNDTENAGVTIHPTNKLSLSANQEYLGDLSGYLAQSLNPNGLPVAGVNLGQGTHSLTEGAGVGYQMTNYLASSAQATHYDQTYFGQNHTGTFVSGTLSYGKRLFNMFSFTANVIDSSIDEQNNAVGFMGNVNYFHRIQNWETSGNFSYAQNVQTILITYTTSYYNYSGQVHRRFGEGLKWHWSASVGGTHSGLSQTPGSTNHSESYSTAFGNRRFNLQATYSQGIGESILGGGGLLGLPPTPGVTNQILFSGDSYGGGISGALAKNLVIAGVYSRAISNTVALVSSHNDTQIYNAQLQYHMRKISFQAGYTRFTQGISILGLPASTTSYYAGFSRWFNFF